MYRCVAAFLVLLVSTPLVASSVDAKAAMAPAPKRMPAQKPAAKKSEQPAQQAQIKAAVRTESAVVAPDADFTAPEGALYTTSDECG